MGKLLKGIPATIVRVSVGPPNVNRETKRAKKDLERRMGRKIARREFAVLLKNL